MSDYHDYNEDLAFEPKMTWEELKGYAKQNKLYRPHVTRDDFFIGSMFFRYNGEIRANGIIIAENKTPEQMKTIIEALFE